MSDKTKEEILQDLILVNTRLHSEDVILEMFTSIPPEGCKQIILAAMEEYRQSSPVESKWVSVKERLPEDEQEVLCNTGSKRVVMARFFAPDKFQIQKYHVAGDRTSVNYWSDVTHWMELPPIEEPK